MKRLHWNMKNNKKPILAWGIYGHTPSNIDIICITYAITNTGTLSRVALVLLETLVYWNLDAIEDLVKTRVRISIQRKQKMLMPVFMPIFKRMDHFVRLHPLPFSSNIQFNIDNWQLIKMVQDPARHRIENPVILIWKMSRPTKPIAEIILVKEETALWVLLL